MPGLKRKRFIRDVLEHTPLVKMILALIILWLLFSAGVWWSERGIEGTGITSFGGALYWGVAAFSTAGIADMPRSGAGQIIGGLWIVLGSMLFFGAIIATITAYFMSPLQRPLGQIINTIEYHLEKLDDLTLEELELLKKTVDTLIEHVETVTARKLEKRGEQSDESMAPDHYDQ